MPMRTVLKSMDVRLVIDSTMGKTFIMVPRYMGRGNDPDDPLLLAIDSAEDEMEKRGLVGEWNLITSTIFRWGYVVDPLDRLRRIPPVIQALSFKIEEVSSDDDEMALALRGDMMNPLQPKILKISWSSGSAENDWSTPTLRVEEVENRNLE